MTLAVYVLRRVPAQTGMREGGFVIRPVEIATCDDDSLGFCLATLRDEDQISDRDAIGVLERADDGEPPWPIHVPGRWLINPYGKGR